jgi:glycerol-3-phosphate dehydrogenase subunit B
MTQDIRCIETDLAVIGSGLAGVAASIFAHNRHIKTAQTGNTGALAYTTGYLDLLGNSRNNEEPRVSDPWEAIRKLQEQDSEHPYSRITEQDIRSAFKEFISFISVCGIDYSMPEEMNLDALTPAGTLKKTMSMPATMRAGVEAFTRKAPCVIIDFKGLKGFSGKQIVANLKTRWPQLRCERITFPDLDQGEVYPEVLARALEVPAHRSQLAAMVKAVAGDAKFIGMPAILGIHGPDLVMRSLQELIGIPLFEIPTMPPSVPGIRLRELVEQAFPEKGMTVIPQQKVLSIDWSDKRAQLHLNDSYGPLTIDSRAVILATGRFISGGLEARMDNIIEPLVGIPVAQPKSREQWYRQKYLDKQGHDIHRAGIEVDASYRPLGPDGKPMHKNLFAAGIIIAHQDWIRERCGAGIAISTAFKAVESAAQFLSQQ